MNSDNRFIDNVMSNVFQRLLLS